MASTLHHHPDGHVYVRTAAGVYGDTPENFALDYGSAWPALPEGMTERLYVQETRHALMARHDLADGGPMPWPEGDAIIAGIARLLEAQRVRVAAQVAAARAARAAERDAAIMPVQRRQFFQELARRGEITRAEAPGRGPDRRHSGAAASLHRRQPQRRRPVYGGDSALRCR